MLTSFLMANSMAFTVCAEEDPVTSMMVGGAAGIVYAADEAVPVAADEVTAGNEDDGDVAEAVSEESMNDGKSNSYPVFDNFTELEPFIYELDNVKFGTVRNITITIPRSNDKAYPPTGKVTVRCNDDFSDDGDLIPLNGNYSAVTLNITNYDYGDNILNISYAGDENYNAWTQDSIPGTVVFSVTKPEVIIPDNYAAYTPIGIDFGSAIGEVCFDCNGYYYETDIERDEERNTNVAWFTPLRYGAFGENKFEYYYYADGRWSSFYKPR